MDRICCILYTGSFSEEMKRTQNSSVILDLIAVRKKCIYVCLVKKLYTMKDFHEQKITRTLALTQLFLKKIGAGVCRVHGGGFAGVIAAIVPEKEQDNYVEYISRFVGRENVYPMDIRAVGAAHIG